MTNGIPTSTLLLSARADPANNLGGGQARHGPKKNSGGAHHTQHRKNCPPPASEASRENLGYLAENLSQNKHQ